MRNFFSTAYRYAWKRFVGPFKYGYRDGNYNAVKYWTDRYKKYNHGYRASGEEGLSEEANKQLYQENFNDFVEWLVYLNIDVGIEYKSVLEIGSGTGVYTNVFRSFTVKDFTGIDVVASQVDWLRGQYPGYTFCTMDATEELPARKFDIVVAVDVVEHIVKKNALASMCRNITNVLADNGVVILCPLHMYQRNSFFYCNVWSLADVTNCFPYEWKMSMPYPYKKAYMVAISNSNFYSV